MVERVPRPSRLIQSVARWAITLGGAGSIVGGTALYRVLINREPAADVHGLLVLAASLLSLAFVLAPFVRRTFGGPWVVRPETPMQRTLLDELRESPRTAEGTEPVPEPVIVPASADADAAATSFTTRVVVAVYAIFAILLLLILWLLQTRP